MGEVMMDTVEIVRRLKEAGYTIFGLSNWSESKFNLVKDRLVFLDYLDDYVLSGKVKQAKPEPENSQSNHDKGERKGRCIVDQGRHIGKGKNPVFGEQAHI